MTMNKALATLKIVAFTVIVYGMLWYVSGGLSMPEMVLATIIISISIAYLFYEALSCRKLGKRNLKLGIFRRLDIREFARIFGAIALLPTAALILSEYTFSGLIKPIRLYVLFVLLFFVGWAVGTVETAKLLEENKEE